ncbi:MAG: FecR family protein [Acetobacteraceae bacterium]
MISPLDQRARWSASRWFAHLRSTEVSDATDLAFRRWLRRDRRNEEEFERQEFLWEMLREMPGDPDIARLIVTTTAPRSNARQGLWSWPTLASAAASCIAIALVSVGLWHFTHSISGQPPLSVERVYATRVGEQQRVTLTDGSQAVLNTGTQLREVFTRQVRRVVLEHGEAVFLVRHDKRWPFVVVAGGTSTQDIGTTFDVLHLDDRTDVSVLEGHVQVDATSGPPARRELLLGAGQATAYTPRAGLGQVTAANLTRIAFWQAGQIEFDDSTLLKAVADFNRYIRMKMVIGDPAIDELRVSGVFHIDDVRAFVKALQDTFSIRVEARNSTYVLLPPVAASKRSGRSRAQ